MVQALCVPSQAVAHVRAICQLRSCRDALCGPGPSSCRSQTRANRRRNATGRCTAYIYPVLFMISCTYRRAYVCIGQWHCASSIARSGSCGDRIRCDLMTRHRRACCAQPCCNRSWEPCLNVYTNLASGLSVRQLSIPMTESPHRRKNKTTKKKHSRKQQYFTVGLTVSCF
jgi:hypothetical protein